MHARIPCFLQGTLRPKYVQRTLECCSYFPARASNASVQGPAVMQPKWRKSDKPMLQKKKGVVEPTLVGCDAAGAGSQCRKETAFLGRSPK